MGVPAFSLNSLQHTIAKPIFLKQVSQLLPDLPYPSNSTFFVSLFKKKTKTNHKQQETHTSTKPETKIYKQQAKKIKTIKVYKNIITLGHWACPEVWLRYSGRLHCRRPMFSFAGRHQLVRDGNLCSLPAFSTVYLEPVHALCLLSQCLSSCAHQSCCGLQALFPCSHPSPLSLTFLPLPP